MRQQVADGDPVVGREQAGQPVLDRVVERERSFRDELEYHDRGERLGDAGHRPGLVRCHRSRWFQHRVTSRLNGGALRGSQHAERACRPTLHHQPLQLLLE